MLATAETALASGDRAGALAALRALFRPASPLWSAEDWAHAFELAAKAARGTWGARVITALGAAAAAPSDPPTLTALGAALIDAGAADAAAGVLWRAQLAAPEGRTALLELCHALELQGQYTTSVQFLEGARPTTYLEHHVLAINALLARDRVRAERARAARPAAASEAEVALGQRLDAMFARLGAIDGVSALDASDERGWWYVWTGTVLGLTPDASASPASWLRASLEVLSGALMLAGMAGPKGSRWLQTVDTPEARVLARAASAVLDRPLEVARAPGAPGLWAVPDVATLGTLGASAQVAFRWRAPQQLVFAAMADRRLPLAWCPEIIGLTERVAWEVGPAASPGTAPGAAASAAAQAHEDARVADIVLAPFPAAAGPQLAELGRFLAAIRGAFGPPPRSAREAWVRPGGDAWTTTGWAFDQTMSGARTLPCRFPATHLEVAERRPRASVPALDEALGWLTAGRWAHAQQLIQPHLERLRTTDDWRVAFQILATAMRQRGESLAGDRLLAAKASPLDPQVTGAAAEALAQAGRAFEAAALYAWTTALAPAQPRWLEAMCAVLTADHRTAIARRLVGDLGVGQWIEGYWRAWEALRRGDAGSARAAWHALLPGDPRRKAWLGAAIMRIELLPPETTASSAPAGDDARVRHWIESGTLALRATPIATREDLVDALAALAQALEPYEAHALAIPSGRRVSQIVALTMAALLDRPAVPAESGYATGAPLVVASVDELTPPALGAGPRVALWAERRGPQRAGPELRATLAVGAPFLGGPLEALGESTQTSVADAAAALADAVRIARVERPPLAREPHLAALAEFARLHPELGPRAAAPHSTAYWPDAPWPDLG